MERKKNQPTINLRVQAVLQNKGSYPLNPARLAKMERAVWRVGYSGRKSIPRKGEYIKIRQVKENERIDGERGFADNRIFDRKGLGA